MLALEVMTSIMNIQNILIEIAFKTIEINTFLYIFSRFNGVVLMKSYGEID